MSENHAATAVASASAAAAPVSTRRVLELMQRFQEHADRRAARERELIDSRDAAATAARDEWEAADKASVAAHAARRRELENDYPDAKKAAHAEWEAALAAAEGRLAEFRRQGETRCRQAVADAQRRSQEAQWQALAVFDAQKLEPPRLLQEAQQRLHAVRLQIEGLHRDAHTLLELRGLVKAARAVTGDDAGRHGESTASPAKGELLVTQPEEAAERAATELRELVLAFQDLRLSSWLLERRRWVWWLLAALATGAVGGGIFGGGTLALLAAGGGAGLLVGGVLVAALLPSARRQSLSHLARVRRSVNEAHQLRHLAGDAAERRSAELAGHIARSRDADVAAAQETCRGQVAAYRTDWQEELDAAEAAHGAGVEQLQRQRSEALAFAEATFPPQLEENARRRAASEAELARRRDDRLDSLQQEFLTNWRDLVRQWREQFADVAEELAAMESRLAGYYPDWSATDLATWQRPATPPEALALGRSPLPLAMVKNGLSAHADLRPPIEELELPAAVCFAEQPRLMITAEGEGRRAAAEVLRLAALRLLTAMPAGKLRLTIIDPAGLGDNFGAFMHLADYDEQLVAGRIFTAPKAIDDRLALISDHMERVLQKYLRNEFRTIQQYNESAGEVAEPYHAIVVANFPTGFTENAARRLLSIAANGPRCGVYVLASIDRQERLPHEFKLGELLVDSVHLDWNGKQFLWRYPLFEKLPLQLDRTPPAERLTEVLRIAGRQSKEASRVEVPFALAAPKPGHYWQADSARELTAPIGRAGAMELQSLRLGLGTSQHVLISGKTGSGKSSLLHALITNLALHYGPDQLEYYLVDFKKGVEFKGYATGDLPHARVIAIESEREFGVSVLERLDQELRRRGEMFRQLGVQDLAAFRRAAPDVVMPRTLLIVDEFQELFVADDRLAQDAALLLDRLVRQGRAFGVHVLLGSQTLAGAYSLARSTLGQMAVRIALECSEADSHIILADENNAARLLSRPGEAIYNDQNGLVAGNHLFQVVWLPDAQRQAYLRAMRALPTPRRPSDQQAIVFEGNVPADPRDNEELVDALAASSELDPAAATQEATIWLGSAVRIEPPTRVVLRRQGGHNMAIVGPQEEHAAGILANATAALAAQQGRGGARFVLLDGARPESPVRNLWQSLGGVLESSAQIVPPRGAADAMTQLSAELAQRIAAPDDVRPPIYVVIYDLAQFRELRQSEEDYGFSFGAGGKPPSPDRRFRELLKEGPAAGIHTLLWCESYNSLTRYLDRVTMRELEYRIAMQISAADSTSLIDSPAATLLGEHRALLYRDDLGTQTKFRPYGAPDEAWLARLAEQLRWGRPIVAATPDPATPAAE